MVDHIWVVAAIIAMEGVALAVLIILGAIRDDSEEKSDQ